MNKKGKKLITLILLIALFITVVPQYQPTFAADEPVVADGRVLTALCAGDNSDWIEIARYGGYSLILRKALIGKSDFGSTSNYLNSKVYTTVNNWFNNTLPPSSRLRDYTVKNDSRTKLGYWSTVPADSFSRPDPVTAPQAARTGNDVAFALNYSEAAIFCSTQYAVNNGSSYLKSTNPATNNFNRLEQVLGGQPINHWWLRTAGNPPSYEACTVGLGGFNIWGTPTMQGAVYQYNITSNIIGIRPALWVGSGIFTDSYTLTYNANGGSGAPSPQQAVANSYITLSSVKPTWGNHTFLGWSLNQYAATPEYQPGALFNIGTGNKTLYAVWGSAVKYTLYYNANSGSGAPPSQQAVANSNVTISSIIPTRANYAFLGWSLNQYAASPDYQPGGIINIGTGDKTLYAVWTASSGTGYMLYYNANGGSGAPPPQSGAANTNIKISDAVPTRANYTFLGWSESQSATAPSYQPGGTINIGMSNKTLFAVWAGNTGGPCGVNGRTLPPSKSGDKVDWIEIARYGGSSLIFRTSYLNIQPGIGYYGKPEWQDTDFHASNNIYSTSILRKAINAWFNCDAPAVPGIGEVDNLPLTARMRKYTMANDAASIPGTSSTTAAITNGFSKPNSNKITIGDDVAFPLSFSESVNFCSLTYHNFDANPQVQTSNSIARANYVKVSMLQSYYYGLWLRSAGTSSYTAGCLSNNTVDNGRAFQAQVSSRGYGEYMLTYPALWVDSSIFDEDSYKLYYNANGGTGAPSPQDVPTNTITYISQIRPTFGSFTFLGWSLDPAATAAEYQPGDPFNIGVGDKTLYAVWDRGQVTQYTLHYNANGGTNAPPDQSAQENTIITLSLDIPLNTGYTFLGWASSQSATVPEYQPGALFNIGTSDKTLYAVWERIVKYTLTYDANGGTNAPPSQDADANTFITLSNILPVWDSIGFLGWAVTHNATEAQYQPGDQFNIGNSNKTLYAVWDKATIIVLHQDIQTHELLGEPETYTVPSGNYGPYGPKTFPGYGPGQHLITSDPPSGTANRFETKTIVYEYEKTVRTVSGSVWPIVTENYGLGDAFFKMHDIVVELRPTFGTPAAPELRTSAYRIPDSNITNVGRFTFEDVPVGNYVLCIKRPGYIIRCMNVTISPSDPMTIELAPPYNTDDNGIFKLWWGDATDHMRVDSLDIIMIVYYVGINASDSRYVPSCDLNADGIIDSLDILMAVDNTNKFFRQYAGAGDVDFDH